MSEGNTGNPEDFVEEMARKHWEYLQGVLEAHGVEWNTIKPCGHHYRTAFVHGFKHGIEYEQGKRMMLDAQYPHQTATFRE